MIEFPIKKQSIFQFKNRKKKMYIHLDPPLGAIILNQQSYFYFILNKYFNFIKLILNNNKNHNSYIECYAITRQLIFSLYTNYS